VCLTKFENNKTLINITLFIYLIFNFHIIIYFWAFNQICKSGLLTKFGPHFLIRKTSPNHHREAIRYHTTLAWRNNQFSVTLSTKFKYCHISLGQVQPHESFMISITFNINKLECLSKALDNIFGAGLGACSYGTFIRLWLKCLKATTL
jgi:hypothetical protein